MLLLPIKHLSYPVSQAEVINKYLPTKYWTFLDLGLNY